MVSWQCFTSVVIALWVGGAIGFVFGAMLRRRR